MNAILTKNVGRGMLFLSVLFLCFASCKKNNDTSPTNSGENNNGSGANESVTKPKVDFSFNPQTVQAWDTVFIEASTKDGSSEVTIWTWDFGDVNKSSAQGQNTNFVYDTAGTYTITLIAKDDNSHSDTVTKDITVKMPKTPFADGTGIETDPYLIAYPNQLKSMQDLDWSATTADNPIYFKLTKDIDMNNQEWTPLDPGNSQFINFDGSGHIIKNLTVENGSYVSMFGVLVGTVKNLGLVDVDIESTSSGAGAFAGYVGFKGPNKPTGLIENCFSTGTVSGPDAVGGIAGNIGKPNSEGPSTINNCFSTVNVTATNGSTHNSRAGGLTGIIYEGGLVENSFASGNVESKTESGRGAGGITGWADSDLKNLAALNKDVSNAGKEAVSGRICANMGKINGNLAQGTNCWASEDLVLSKGGTQVPEDELNTGATVAKNTSYDGETKSQSFLSDMNNYESAGWEVGSGKPWASTTNNGLPILSWLFERGDYSEFY